MGMEESCSTKALKEAPVLGWRKNRDIHLDS